MELPRSVTDSVKAEIAVFRSVGGSLGPGVGSFGLTGDSFRLDDAFFRTIADSSGSLALDPEPA
jgi:hypothetical protein